MKIDSDAGDGKFKLERTLPVLLIIAIIVISTMILYRLLSGTNEKDSTNAVEIHSPVSEAEQFIVKDPQVVHEEKLEQRDSNGNAEAIDLKENDTEILKEIKTKDGSGDQKTETIISQEEVEESKRLANQEKAEETNRLARQQEAEEAKRLAKQEEVKEAKRMAEQRDFERKQQSIPKETTQPKKKERLDSEWVAKNWEKAREVEVVALLSEAESQLLTQNLSVSILNTAMGKYRSLERITGGDSRVSELYRKIMDSHVILATQQEKAEQLSDAMTTIDNGLMLNSHHRKLLKIKKKVSKKLTKIENLGQSAPLIGTF